MIELDVSNTGIEGLWGIEQYTALQVLDAADNRITDINPLGAAPLSDSLRELRLGRNAIVDVTALAPYHALHTLWLSGNAGIDFMQLRPIIEQNPDLTRLGLGDIDVHEPGLPWFNINHAAVIELDVSNTGIKGLWGIEQYTALQVLDAADNRIADINPLFNLPAQKFVDLGGNTGISCVQLDQLEQILALRSGTVLRPATCVVGQAPIVTITQPIGGFAIFEGQPAILNASASDAEDGDIGASIQWSSDLHGLLGTGAFLEIPLLPGDQTLSATVTDSDGNTAAHSVNILVLFNNAPTVEIHSPPEGISIIEGDQLNLDGYAFDSEDGDLTTAIQWSSSIDGTLGGGSGLSVTLTPGEHTLTASATDQWGKTAAATTAVTVVANASPTVTITTPDGDVTVIEGVPLILLGNAYDDEDGALTHSIQWSSDINGALGTGALLEVTLAVGTHQITASAIDSRGKSALAVRQVTVAFINPPQLSLASPNDGLQIEQYLPLALSAVATDVEDGDLSTDITWTSNVSESLGTGAAMAVTLPLGTHIIAATITDHNGKMMSITRNVTVIAPAVAEYCQAGGTTSSLWIESVSVAGITNTSGSQGGYADFTGLGPIFLDRESNAIDLVPGFARQDRNVHWSVWIDLNRDGAFTNNELLFTAASKITVSGSITIPAVADAGLTRMRVMMTRRDNAKPCQDSRASEVEDYAVVLLP